MFLSSSSLFLMIILFTCVNTKSDIPDWSGIWRGIVNVYPKENGPDGLEMTLELGPFPTIENNCTKWNVTYRQEGKIVAIKDYRLCRRNSDEDLFTDEGNGIILDSQWIGNELLTSYKVNNIFYIVINKLNGKYFEEEIITINEKNSTENIQSLKIQTIYKTILKRVTFS